MFRFSVPGFFFDMALSVGGTMMAADAPLAHPGSLRLAQGVWVHFRALVWWLNGNFRLATVGRVNVGVAVENGI